jgi:L-seryl-tRNA(Ser) seleniumtransferase
MGLGDYRETRRIILSRMEPENPLRELPGVNELLGDPRLAALEAEHGHDVVLAAAREAVAHARNAILAGERPDDRDLVADALDRAEGRSAPRLRRVLNATGVIVHTNLGRAPLAPAALERIRAAGLGYSNLEYDLESGARGSRQDHLAELLRSTTGAEAALVVNNNAAAVLLAVAALAEGRDVLVSRGELVEIGDGFRIPEVLARSGARLVEVGTTNRTRIEDYERAAGERTALILRVHPSNFRIVGFTDRPDLGELRVAAERLGLLLVDDLGSGVLAPVGDEPTVQGSIAAGAHLVTFSGDKLLGGPQAGIAAGRADLVERLRRHPLQRALRADKLTIAALEGTLALYRAGSAPPVMRMLTEPAEAVHARAKRLAELTGGRVEATVARAGGGSLPATDLESFACALEEDLEEPLRLGKPPVIGIVRDGQLLLDCRTLTDDEVEEAASAVVACRSR